MTKILAAAAVTLAALTVTPVAPALCITCAYFNEYTGRYYVPPPTEAPEVNGPCPAGEWVVAELEPAVAPGVGGTIEVTYRYLCSGGSIVDGGTETRPGSGGGDDEISYDPPPETDYRDCWTDYDPNDEACW